MTPDGAVYLLQEALRVLLVLAGPLLVGGLVIGLVVSLVQAATQMQDMTLSFVPKLAGAAVLLALFGPWLLQVAVDYVKRMLLSLGAGIP
ncbi:flagellar biosynthesis protein FliQ [Thermanaeromonas toyohensis]|uniref:flagellar biosynthesis protein FliQ n=1 Tax=Thermanaeromonas toyohensis TaxID=161154 RepID=UPI000A01CD8A|nr:flagellar biosynthesis protein FliQ [Thermanaeromonas toyohensis]